MADDFTKSISVRSRLLATIISGLIFALLSGYTLQNLDIIGLNGFLALPLFGYLFTAFAIGGVANSINLIDGFHGLAAGTLVFICLAFSLIGWRVGDMGFVTLSTSFAAIFAGFLVVNFPFGRLFLGDGGAYFAGYLVAVLAVMLPLRNPEVSPWISLVVLGYPITETLVSIIRRVRKFRTRLGQPDRGHLHHMIYQTIVPLHSPAGFGFASKNATTSLIVWSLPALTLVFAGFSGLKFGHAILGLVVMVAYYVLCYRLAVHFGAQKSIGGHNSWRVSHE